MAILKTTGFLAASLAMAATAWACGGNPLCTVKDPTGTPLNIRASPNGKILGNAPNGTVLEFIDHVDHKGSRWARVARFDVNTAALTEGAVYLFGPYLKCDADLASASDNNEILCRVADPTSTPLNIRIAPGGEIAGTVRNGETVRVYGSKMHKGRLWAEAYRQPGDNTVGWVFDPYLKCEEDGH